MRVEVRLAHPARLDCSRDGTTNTIPISGTAIVGGAARNWLGLALIKGRPKGYHSVG